MHVKQTRSASLLLNPHFWFSIGKSRWITLIKQSKGLKIIWIIKLQSIAFHKQSCTWNSNYYKFTIMKSYLKAWKFLLQNLTKWVCGLLKICMFNVSCCGKHIKCISMVMYLFRCWTSLWKLLWRWVMWKFSVHFHLILSNSCPIAIMINFFFRVSHYLYKLI